MLKHGLIYDKSYWEQFLDLTAIDFADFDELIYQSVVVIDPTENQIIELRSYIMQLKVIFLRRIKRPYYMVKPLLWDDFRNLFDKKIDY
jgi:hypothetical protein